MLNKEELERLTDAQVLQLDNVLKSFHCEGIRCEFCPMRISDPFIIKFASSWLDGHVVQCGRVYIAARSFDIKYNV